MWAKSLKLSGASSLSMIINGQRHPGPQVSAKLADYFKFNESERSYFLGLISLGKSRNEAEISILLKERLQKINPRKNVRFIDEHMYGLLSSWVPYAVREMTKLNGFEATPAWIAEHLRFKAGKQVIKKAILDLKAFKMIEVHKNGTVRASEVEIDSEPDVENHATRVYQSATLDLAKEALNDCPIHQRDFSSLTMTINAEDFPELKRRIRYFLDQVQRDFEVKHNGNSTIQLQIQSFPYNNYTKKTVKPKRNK